MSFHQKNAQCSTELPFQTHREMQGVEGVQVFEALEESQLSSHPLMPGSSKEVPEASIPSASEGLQSFCSYSIAITATSSSKWNVGASNQEEEDSTSLPRSDTKNVPIHELDYNVGLLVNFLLHNYRTKEPTTKADMLKSIIREYKDHFFEIFLRASHCLEFIFGLDVKEVDPTNHCYGLFIKLGLTYDGMMPGEEDVPKTGILILTLGVIFMNGNRIIEQHFWKVLTLSGICPGRKHFIFGEPTELITKVFMEEKYLKYQPVAFSDSVQFEFLWGLRAHCETTKMQVLEFVAKFHGTHPSSFPSQDEEALQDEEKACTRIRVGAVSTSVPTSGSNTKPSSFYCT